MPKITIVGLLLGVLGLLTAGYQALAAATGKANGWVDIGIADLFSNASFDWIDSLPWDFAVNGAVYLVTMPLYILLFILCGVLLLASMFLKQ